LKSHPNITFNLANPPYAFNLSCATIGSRGVGSLTLFGWAATSIARGIAALSLLALSVPGRLAVRPVLSLMYTSAKPRGSMGTSIMSSLPIAKGMSLSRRSLFGMLAWTEACKVCGSQSLHFSSSFARSQIVSGIIPHSNGQGAPPNVSRRVMITRLLSGSCVAVCRAVVEWRIPQR
jgi:hypothetical protein